MSFIFDGKKLALEKEKKLAAEVVAFKKKTGRSLKLVSVMVGENPASRLYLKLKGQAAKRVGIGFEKIKLSGLKEAVEVIEKKNKDQSVTGLMVQLPVPGSEQLVSRIDPQKDVDCLTPTNFGLLMMGRPRFLPATVKGIMAIIKASDYPINNSTNNSIRGQVVVVGASNIVGKPLALHLSNLGATVTICRSKTKNLPSLTKKADLLISATGVPGLIKKEMVKKGVVVIDVGSPQGDVDFAEIKEVASLITPVPGGVGPLTVVSLLENVLLAVK